MDDKAYKRCEFIVRRFMSVENPPAELAAMFHDWLLDGHNCREKTAVFRKLFEEAVFDGKSPQKQIHTQVLPPPPKKTPA